MYIYMHYKKPSNYVLDAKMVLKIHLFIKIFCFLYRSFVSIIRMPRNIKQQINTVINTT